MSIEPHLSRLNYLICYKLANLKSDDGSVQVFTRVHVPDLFKFFSFPPLNHNNIWELCKNRNSILLERFSNILDIVANNKLKQQNNILNIEFTLANTN